jgi:hypothetical protein
MRALTTSFASVCPQLSPVYASHEGASRSRQALEAVDAYLRRDSTYSAPRVSGFRLSLFLNSLVGKLLK